MDIIIASYLLLFGTSFAVSLGLFDGGSDDETATTPPTSTSPLYRADDYDRVETGSASDDLATEPESSTADIAWFSGAGNDAVTSAGGNDYVEAGDGNDTLVMAAGNDIIQAGDGNDRVDAGAGLDLILGGNGADSLDAGDGIDTVNGGAGNDTILGSGSNDSLSGDDGDDYISGFGNGTSAVGNAVSPDGVDTLNGGAGNDTLLIGPGDNATGGAGNDAFALDQRSGGFGTLTRITDFAVGDVIELVVSPQVDPSGANIPPVVALRANTTGTGSILSVDGTDVAEILGTRTLTLADLRIQDT